MNSVCELYRSTIGKKFVVALTGSVLFGFVLGHMTGNLKAFAGVGVDGVHKLDVYAHFLREVGTEMFGHGGLLWIARGVLLLALLLHVATIVQLQARNSASRPVGYKVSKLGAATPASRSMLYGGFAILAFVIYHILHMTTGNLHFAGFEEGKVYQNVVNAFGQWHVTLIYAVAMFALGMHLYHGVWSFCQTVGIDNPERNAGLRILSKLAAFVIAVGFISVPVAVFLGVLS